MLLLKRASLVALMGKNLPAMQEIWVWSLVWENPLEKGMATHSCVLAWRIPWTEELGSYSLWGCKESDMTLSLCSCHLLARLWGVYEALGLVVICICLILSVNDLQRITITALPSCPNIVPIPLLANSNSEQCREEAHGQQFLLNQPEAVQSYSGNPEESIEKLFELVTEFGR